MDGEAPWLWEDGDEGWGTGLGFWCSLGLTFALPMACRDYLVVMVCLPRWLSETSPRVPVRTEGLDGTGGGLPLPHKCLFSSLGEDQGASTPSPPHFVGQTFVTPPGWEGRFCLYLRRLGGQLEWIQVPPSSLALEWPKTRKVTWLWLTSTSVRWK